MEGRVVYENQSDHRAILDELKRLREDFQKVIVVTQEEQRQHRKEVREEFEAIREVIKEITTAIHKVDKNSEAALTMGKNNKGILATIGGVLALVLIGGVGKSLGWY